MTKPIDERPWISLRGVARVLHASPKVAARLARSGLIRSRVLRSMPRQYAREDALKLAAEAVAAGSGGRPGA